MGRKYFSTLIVFILLLSTAGGLSAARKKRVAVLNFSNYGPRNIAFLKNALPESLSSSLSEVKDIRVIERRQLGRIINELALEQTGMVNTRGVNRAGRLARADVLILGSISGSKKRIIVTMKAVEVATGKVLDGKVVKASIGDVFDRAGEAARTMAAIISGKGIGRLSVSTVPAGAKVYIDGLYAGTTPIVEYKLVKGEHRVKVTKNGYIDYETDVEIKARDRKQITSQLSVDTVGNRSELNFYISYYSPFNEDLKGSLYYAFNYGHSFNQFVLSFEFGFSYFGHDQLIDTGTADYLQEKNFLLLQFLAGVRYNLLPLSWAISRYVQPYVGGVIGYSPLVDYKTISEENERLETSHLFTVGAIAGANLFPFSRFSLFAECRYIAHFPEANRSVRTGPWFDPVETTEKIYLNGMYLGGGARFYF